MVPNGYQRKYPDPSTPPEGEQFKLVLSNQDLETKLGVLPIEDFIRSKSLNYLAHTCRQPNTSLVKTMLFAKPIAKNYTDIWLNLARQLGVSVEQSKSGTQDRKAFSELLG